MAALHMPPTRKLPGVENRAVSLRFLEAFAWEHDAWLRPTHEVVAEIVTPATVNLLEPFTSLLSQEDVGPATLFMSHAWSNPFGLVVAAARKFTSDAQNRQQQAKKKHSGGSQASSSGGSKNAASGRGKGGKVGGTSGAAKQGRGDTRAVEPIGTETRCGNEVFIWVDIFAITQHPGDAQVCEVWGRSAS